jgi:hypothetical protein
VRLPAGLQYNRIESDTFEGEFVARSGRIVIHHDIGTTAGAWAQTLNAEFFEERLVDGARVWVAERKRGGEGRRKLWSPQPSRTTAAPTSSSSPRGRAIGAPSKRSRRAFARKIPRRTSPAGVSRGSEPLGFSKAHAILLDDPELMRGRSFEQDGN